VTVGFWHWLSDRFSNKGLLSVYVLTALAVTIVTNTFAKIRVYTSTHPRKLAKVLTEQNKY
ncbi:hypothetical protein, partial [Nostoc sp.]|uniref:hypothetical protein n=1 Tax=Nostoc sp. TaxID=1180 RepID=UPI002FFA3A88